MHTITKSLTQNVKLQKTKLTVESCKLFRQFQFCTNFKKSYAILVGKDKKYQKIVITRKKMNK